MSWNLEIDHIAGILDGETTIKSGLNVVRAENWQGKSSLILAVEAAMGTTKPLTEGASEGEVSLETSDEIVSVRFARQGQSVVRHGEPYLDDEYDRTVAELYAFLDESNPIRQAVRNGENLEEYLTKPLALENIDEQITELKAERDAVDAELERATDAAEELVAVESEITSLEQELADFEDQREKIDRSSTDTEGREELSEARRKQESLTEQIEQLESSIEQIEQSLSERRNDLDALEIPESPSIDKGVQDLNDRLQQLETDIELMQSVYTANRRVLDEGRVELLSDVERGLLGDSIECWTCGSETETETIETRLETLQDRISELQAKKNDLQDRVRNVEETKRKRRQKQREEKSIKKEISRLEERLSDRRDSLKRKRDSLESVRDRVEELQQSVSETEDELTEVESEIKYTKSKLDEAKDRRETLEQRAEKRSTLEEERESLSAEIESLRNRREEMKARARESFSESIAEIVERFDTSYESARLTSEFDLVVAREGREVSLDALSEGEVVLLECVAALAGFDAYDVADRVPLILVDSLGELTDKNLHLLVDYLDDRSDRVVCTAYPEQSSFDGHEIDPASWTVVSDERPIDATS